MRIGLSSQEKELTQALIDRILQLGGNSENEFNLEFILAGKTTNKISRVEALLKSAKRLYSSITENDSHDTITITIITKLNLNNIINIEELIKYIAKVTDLQYDGWGTFAT
jgi:regulator of RNase E activity RraB